MAVWGVIERADGRGGWRYCHDLATVFGLDDDLRVYAEDRARLVDHSPTGARSFAFVHAPGTEPNQNERRTKNRMEVARVA